MSLLKIQSELKAPKNQRNSFGNYNYRSCEDILEAVKPLCLKYDATLIISDEIVEVGGRVYVKATAKISFQSGQQSESTAYAREPEIKKGMDESQITGAASSYARKYALNGLFCIDDTKDADTMQPEKKEEKQPGDYDKALKAIQSAESVQELIKYGEMINNRTWKDDQYNILKNEIDMKMQGVE